VYPRISEHNAAAKGLLIEMGTVSVTFWGFDHQTAYMKTAHPTCANVLSSNKVMGKPDTFLAMV